MSLHLLFYIADKIIDSVTVLKPFVDELIAEACLSYAAHGCPPNRAFLSIRISNSRIAKVILCFHFSAHTGHEGSLALILEDLFDLLEGLAGV